MPPLDMLLKILSAVHPHSAGGQQLLQALQSLPVSGGIGNEPGIHSVGGSIQSPFGQAGGVLGIDHGIPFGGVNINHQPVAAFGPGDDSVNGGLVDVGGRPASAGPAPFSLEDLSRRLAPLFAR